MHYTFWWLIFTIKTHSLTTFWKDRILSPPSWVEVSEGKAWLTRVWVIFNKVRCLAELCTHKAFISTMWFIFNEKLKKFLIWKFKVSHVPVISVVLHVLRVWPGQGWMRVEIWKISYYRLIRRKFWFFAFILILKSKMPCQFFMHHTSYCRCHLLVKILCRHWTIYVWWNCHDSNFDSNGLSHV